MTVDLKTLFDRQTEVLEARLRRYARELVIDVGTQVRGQLANRHLAPLDFNFASLFTGQLGLDKGGTGQDFSNAGPGAWWQDSTGGIAQVGPLPANLIDFSVIAGAANVPLVSDGLGGAAFTAIDVTNDDWRSGLLPPRAGGTGVNNSTRTLTIATNGGTLAFSAASKTLTIADSGTAALIGLSNQVFSENNSFAKILRANLASGSTGYGIRLWDGTNDYASLSAINTGGITSLFLSANRFYDGDSWEQHNTRAGGAMRIDDAGLNFYRFDASSSTPIINLSSTGNGLLDIYHNSATTNTAPIGFRFRHNNGAAAANGFGLTFRTFLDSDATVNRTVNDEVTIWATAADGTRKARKSSLIYDTAARTAIIIEASGTAAMIGFLGAAAVTRPTVTGSRGGNAALASALTALANLGLITDSSS
jgi:hypothetical protein